MTISTQTVKHIYLADGENRNWAYSFPVADMSDVRLVVQNDAGAQTEPETGVEVRSGVVIYPTEASGLEPVASGSKVIVFRQTPALQGVDLTAQSGFDAEVLEKALDKLTLLAQEVQERLTRTVQVDLSDEGEPSVDSLIASMRALYADIKASAALAGEEAQKAIAAAVEAYEQAEKLYSHMEYYTAGLPELNYTGDLQTFRLLEAYKCDGNTLKVFINGVLKRRGATYDYLEVPDPALATHGDDWGDTVTFNAALSSGDSVCFMWGDTLTMPGGEVAQQAALAAEHAQGHAAAAAASAELAQTRAERFIPKQIGEIYPSQSPLAADNLGAVPGWTGEWVNADQWPGLFKFIKAHPELCKTAEEYSAMLQNYQQAPYYVLDEELGKIRLPIYSRGIQAVQADGLRGAYRDQVQDFELRFKSIDRGIQEGYKNVDVDGRWSADARSGGGDAWGTYLKVKASKMLRTGTETWGAHAREYPWIVAANVLEGIIKYNGGFVAIKGYTQAEYDALQVKPENELSLIEEEL